MGRPIHEHADKRKMLKNKHETHVGYHFTEPATNKIIINLPYKIFEATS